MHKPLTICNGVDQLMVIAETIFYQHDEIISNSGNMDTLHLFSYFWIFFVDCEYRLWPLTFV
ncbi:CLUMA_CG006291, isoform A [Clunio marinus]|uniref:CLUMA_CG006291, isoform A n=1 Tax=Clunio marinus TaxID=568069 RepID=A0A1J1HYW0_9DIPT|nr:CLUMA_CG006291, isoform A [Clunio marinus]